jgi:hypothetical protein
MSSTNTDTLVPLPHCLSLSSCQLELTLPPAHPQQSQQADVVGHHLLLSIVLERISRFRCDPLYATNTSHRKQETFQCEYPLHVLSPTKEHTTGLCSSVVHPQAQSPFSLLKPASEHGMRICYLDCHEAGLYCYLVITHSLMELSPS